MSWILAGIYIAVEIVALASAVHALFTVRTPQGTIAWVVGLIAFPWLGLPLYWFFGSRRFDAHSLAMQKILSRHEAKIHEVHEGMHRFIVPRGDVVPTRIGDLAAIAGDNFLFGSQLDQLLVWLASFAILTELTHPNIHIHRYAAGFLHQKCLLVDDSLAGVGTKNFDNRSFRLNFEITLAVSDPAFVASVAEMLKNDFSHSEETGRDDYETRPLWFKAGARAARLVAPIL
ncbi:MAG: phospholipase D-like domain-containing protein [Verrucomicrobia bacterium]|nr:phospholipase D-like domain-containing protein [Verrucomicrobiota bacterium]